MIWVLATLAAYVVKGLCGFASTMIFITLLSFGQVGSISIIPVDLLLGMPTNATLIWKYRKHIHLKKVLPILLLVVLGSVPGVVFLKNLDDSHAKLFFGILITCLGVQSLLQSKMENLRIPRPALYGIGLLSGIITGLYGVGALLAAYFNQTETDSRALKANMCLVFLSVDLFRVIAYAVTGVFTVEILKQAALLLPVMILGMVVGMRFSNRLNEKKLRFIINVFLILSGIVLVATNL